MASFPGGPSSLECILLEGTQPSLGDSPTSSQVLTTDRSV